MYNSGEFSKNVADGSFKNIYPGNYIVKTKTIDGVTYTDHIDIIVSLNPYYGKWNGTSYIYTHHVAIVPFQFITRSVINTSSTVTGGYASSYIRNNILPKYLTGYKNAYGASHFLTFGELITTSVNSNKEPNNIDWYSTQITLMSENQITGSTIFGGGYNIGEANTQLEAFQYDHALLRFQGYNFWTRSIARGGNFSCVANGGQLYETDPTRENGVRPLMLLY